MDKKNLFFSFAVIVWMNHSTIYAGEAKSSPQSKAGSDMKLTSSAFKPNDPIPPKFTCEVQDINPPLTIEGVPQDAKSLALVIDDPDAPSGSWVHWVVFNISPGVQQIPQNSVPGKQGKNDFDQLKYGGPCPPAGEHRYFFKLYALDILLNLPEGITKNKLEEAMQGHIVARTTLVGVYQKLYDR